MANQIQNQIEIQLQIFEQMMDEDVGNWDIYETHEEFDEDESLPTEEEREELERDLIDMALQTHLKKYTFVRLTPTKKFSC